MYLFKATTDHTFVIVSYNRNSISLKITTYLLGVIVLLALPQLLAGQDPEFMRPGDVNNDGQVSDVDRLLWAIAKGATGPERTFNSIAFEPPVPLRPSDFWEETFVNGLNYLFADCDGNGIVDSLDLEVIRMNFGSVAPGVSVDDTEPDPATNPQLYMIATQQFFLKDSIEEVDLVLRDHPDPNTGFRRFAGISFLFNYNPEDTEFREEIFNLVVTDQAWIAAGDSSTVDFLVTDDRDSGKVELFIWKKSGSVVVPPGGEGQVGTSRIVIAEDLLGSIQAKFELENITIMNDQLRPVPAAGDILIRPIQESVQVIDRETSSRYVEAFPVPAEGELTVRVKDPAWVMDFIEVYDLQGRLWRRVEVNANEVVLDAHGLPSGMFMLKIYTAYGIFVRPVNR